MQELNRNKGMTYSGLAERLRARGYDLTHLEVFEIACRIRQADKKLQETIADILGCLRKDIF
jgi:hypothetical protein